MRRVQKLTRRPGFMGSMRRPAQSRRRNESQAAILTIDSDYQIDTEAETPWQPRSVLSFLECLDSLRVLMIFVEMGSEPAVSKYGVCRAAGHVL